MPDLKEALKKITRLLEKAKEGKSLQGYALIGGFAVSARATPRATRDIDFLIHPEVSFYEILPDLLKKTGYSFKTMTSDRRDPLNNLVRIYDKEGSEIVDLMPTFWKWQDEIIQNAEEVKIATGVFIPVAQTEDLIILKLKAAGPQDIADVHSLIQASRLDRRFNQERLMDLAKRVKVDKKLRNLLG